MNTLSEKTDSKQQKLNELFELGKTKGFLTYDEVIARDLKVMDAAAILICKEQKVPAIRVFALDDPRNILKVVDGDPMGTVVHP